MEEEDLLDGLLNGPGDGVENNSKESEKDSVEEIQSASDIEKIILESDRNTLIEKLNTGNFAWGTQGAMTKTGINYESKDFYGGHYGKASKNINRDWLNPFAIAGIDDKDWDSWTAPDDMELKAFEEQTVGDLVYDTLIGGAKLAGAGFLDMAGSWDLFEVNNVANGNALDETGNWLQQAADSLQESANEENLIYKDGDNMMNLAYWAGQGQQLGYSVGIVGEMVAEQLLLTALTGGSGNALAFASKLKYLKPLLQQGLMGVAGGLRESYMNARETQENVYKKYINKYKKDPKLTPEQAEKQARAKADQAAHIGFKHEAGALMALNTLQNMTLFGGIFKGRTKAPFSRGKAPEVKLGFSTFAEDLLEKVLPKTTSKAGRRTMQYGVIPSITESIEEGIQTTAGAYGEYMVGDQKTAFDPWTVELRDSMVGGGLGGILLGAGSKAVSMLADKQGTRAFQAKYDKWMNNAYNRTNESIINSQIANQEFAKARFEYEKNKTPENKKKLDKAEQELEKAQQNSVLSNAINSLEYDYMKGEGTTAFDAHVGELQKTLDAVNAKDVEALKKYGILKEDGSERFDGSLESIAQTFEQNIKDSQTIKQSLEDNLTNVTGDLESAFNITKKEYQNSKYFGMMDTVNKNLEEAYSLNAYMSQLSSDGQQKFRLQNELFALNQIENDKETKALSPEEQARKKELEKLISEIPYNRQDSLIMPNMNRQDFINAEISKVSMSQAIEENNVSITELKKPETIKKGIKERAEKAIQEAKTLKAVQAAAEEAKKNGVVTKEMETQATKKAEEIQRAQKVAAMQGTGEKITPKPKAKVVEASNTEPAEISQEQNDLFTQMLGLKKPAQTTTTENQDEAINSALTAESRQTVRQAKAEVTPEMQEKAKILDAKYKEEFGENYSLDNIIRDLIERNTFKKAEDLFNGAVKFMETVGRDTSNADAVYNEYFETKESILDSFSETSTTDTITNTETISAQGAIDTSTNLSSDGLIADPLDRPARTPEQIAKQRQEQADTRRTSASTRIAFNYQQSKRDKDTGRIVTTSKELQGDTFYILDPEFVQQGDELIIEVMDDDSQIITVYGEDGKRTNPTWGDYKKGIEKDSVYYRDKIPMGIYKVVNGEKIFVGNVQDSTWNVTENFSGNLGQQREEIALQAREKTEALRQSVLDNNGTAKIEVTERSFGTIDSIAKNEDTTPITLAEASGDRVLALVRVVNGKRVFVETKSGNGTIAPKKDGKFIKIMTDPNTVTNSGSPVFHEQGVVDIRHVYTTPDGTKIYQAYPTLYKSPRNNDSKMKSGLSPEIGNSLKFATLAKLVLNNQNNQQFLDAIEEKYNFTFSDAQAIASAISSNLKMDISKQGLVGKGGYFDVFIRASDARNKLGTLLTENNPANAILQMDLLFGEGGSMLNDQFNINYRLFNSKGMNNVSIPMMDAKGKVNTDTKGYNALVEQNYYSTVRSHEITAADGTKKWITDVQPRVNFKLSSDQTIPSTVAEVKEQIKKETEPTVTEKIRGAANKTVEQTKQTNEVKAITESPINLISGINNNLANDISLEFTGTGRRKREGVDEQTIQTEIKSGSKTLGTLSFIVRDGKLHIEFVEVFKQGQGTASTLYEDINNSLQKLGYDTLRSDETFLDAEEQDTIYTYEGKEYPFSEVDKMFTTSELVDKLEDGTLEIKDTVKPGENLWKSLEKKGLAEKTKNGYKFKPTQQQQVNETAPQLSKEQLALIERLQGVNISLPNINSRRELNTELKRALANTISSTKPENMSDIDYVQLLDAMEHEFISGLDFNGKVTNQDIIDSMENLVESVLSPKIQEMRDLVSAVEGIPGYAEASRKANAIATMLDQILSDKDSLTGKKGVLTNRFNKIFGFDIDDIRESEFSSDNNFQKSFLEKDIKLSYSNRLTMSLFGVPSLKKDDSGTDVPQVNSLSGLPIYESPDYVDAILKSVTTEIKSDWSTLMSRLEQEATAKKRAIYTQLHKRLKDLPQDLKNEMLYKLISSKFTAHKVINSVIKDKDGNEKYVLSVIDENSSKENIKLKNQIKSNFIYESPMSVFNKDLQEWVYDGKYGERLARAFQELALSGKLSGKNKMENLPKLKEVFQALGMNFSDNTMKEYLENNDPFDKRVGILTFLSQTTTELNNKAKNKVVITTDKDNNLYSNAEKALNQIVNLEIALNGTGIARSIRVGGKTLQGTIQNTAASDILKQLREEIAKERSAEGYVPSKLLDDYLGPEGSQEDGKKKGMGYTRNSIFLNLLRYDDNAAKIFLKELIFSSPDSYKVNGKKAFSDTGFDKISDQDAFIRDFGMYAYDKFEKLGNSTDIKLGLDFRVGQMPFMTLSDKGRMIYMKTALLKATNEQISIAEDGSISLDPLIQEMLYEQVFESEYNRILDAYKNEDPNVKSFSEASKIFTALPIFNTIEINGVNIHSIIKAKIESGQEQLEATAFKDVAMKMLSGYINSEVDQKLDSNGEGAVAEADIYENGEIKNIDTKYIQKFKGKPLDKMRKFIAEHSINNMVHQMTLYQVFLGDLAYYAKIKGDKVLDGVTNLNIKEGVAYATYKGKESKLQGAPESYEMNSEGQVVKLGIIDSDGYVRPTVISEQYLDVAETIGQVVDKRSASLIAPGFSLANSGEIGTQNSKYTQIQLSDVESISTIIEPLIRASKDEDQLTQDELVAFDTINNSKDKQEIADAYTVLEKANPALRDYFNMEGTDAQEYTTWKTHIDMLFRQGNLTVLEKEQLQSAYDKMSKGDFEGVSSEELSVVMQPVKPVYTGMVPLKNKEGQTISMRPIYIKSSAFPLLPQVTKNLKIDGIRRNLEALEQERGQMVRASYQTANKIGANKTMLSPSDLYDTPFNGSSYKREDLKFFKDGQEISDTEFYAKQQELGTTQDEFTVPGLKDLMRKGRNVLESAEVELDTKNFKIQQETPDKVTKAVKKGEENYISMGSQFWKALLGNGINKMGAVFPNTFSQEIINEAGIMLEKEGDNLTGEQLDQINYHVYRQFSKAKLDSLFENLKLKKGVPFNAYTKEEKKEVLEKILTTLQNEVATRNYPDYLQEVLNLVEDGNGNVSLESPLFLDSNANKFESLLLSLVTSAAVFHKLPGMGYISTSSEGFERVVNLEEISENDRKGIVWINGQPGRLKSTMLEDGTITSSEVLLKSHYKYQVIEEDGTKTTKLVDLSSDKYSKMLPDGSGRMLDLDKMDQELLEQFSFRIPTSSHQSGVLIKVVGFLPPESGDMLVVPAEHTVQLGEDYDIDKRFMYQSNYTIKEDGAIRKLNAEDFNPNKETDAIRQEMYEELQSYVKELKQENSELFRTAKDIEDNQDDNIDSMMTAIFGEDFNDTSELHQEIANNKVLINDLYTAFRNEKKGINKIRGKYLNKLRREFDIKRYENALIDTYKAVFKSPSKDVQQKIFKPLSVGVAKETAFAMDDKLNKDKNPYFSSLSDMYQRKLLKAGADGKGGIGVHSNAVVLEAAMQRLAPQNKLGLQKTVFVKGKKELVDSVESIGGLTSLSTLGQNLKSIDGFRDIADQHGENQNVSTDNINEQIMAKRNENVYTMGVFALMATRGFDLSLDKVIGNKNKQVHIPSVFMNQPIIRDYVKLKSQQDSITGDFISDKDTAILRELATKYGLKGLDGTAELTDFIPRATYNKLSKDMTGQRLWDSLTEQGAKKYPLMQLAVLQKFAIFQREAKSLSSLQQLISLSTSGLGMSYFETLQRIRALDELPNSLVKNATSLVGINVRSREDMAADMFDSTTAASTLEGYYTAEELVARGYTKVGKYYWFPSTIEGTMLIDALSASQEVMDIFFPYKEASIDRTIDTILSQKKVDRTQRSQAVLEQEYEIMRELRSFMNTFENAKFFKGDINQERRRLFLDTPQNTSLASIIKDIQNKRLPLAENPFIRNLFTQIKSESEPSLILRTNDSNISFDSYSEYSGFERMFLDDTTVLGEYNGEVMTPMKLAQDLVSYAMLADSQNGATGFETLVPAKYLKAINYNETVKDNFNSLDMRAREAFIDQYFQHNPERAVTLSPNTIHPGNIYTKNKTLNNKFKQAVKAAEKGQKIFLGPILTELESFELNDTFADITSDYISIRNTKLSNTTNQYNLYKYNRNTGEYVRIPVLGTRGMKEYNAKAVQQSSVLPSMQTKNVNPASSIFSNTNIYVNEIDNKPTPVPNIEAIFPAEQGVKGILERYLKVPTLPKDISEFIQNLLDYGNLDAKLVYANPTDNVLGQYNAETDEIYIRPDIFDQILADTPNQKKAGAIVREVILEEIIHSMTVKEFAKYLVNPLDGGNPVLVDGAPLFATKLVSLYTLAKESLPYNPNNKDTYYSQNIYEFMAGMFVAPDYRASLEKANPGIVKQFLDMLRDLLGNLYRQKTGEPLSYKDETFNAVYDLLKNEKGLLSGENTSSLPTTKNPMKKIIAEDKTDVQEGPTTPQRPSIGSGPTQQSSGVIKAGFENQGIDFMIEIKGDKKPFMLSWNRNSSNPTLWGKKQKDGSYTTTDTPPTKEDVQKLVDKYVPKNLLNLINEWTEARNLPVGEVLDAQDEIAKKIELELSQQSQQSNTAQAKQTNLVSPAYGVVTANNNPSAAKTKANVDLIAPQIEAQAYKENNSGTANDMFMYGLRWTRKSKAKKPLENKSYANKGIPTSDPLAKDGYVYDTVDQNGNALPPLSDLQPIIKELEDSLSLDMSNYDSVIGNIYLPGQRIATHRDTTESLSARNYPVVVYTIGNDSGITIYENVDSKGNATGKVSFGSDKKTVIPTKNGSMYTFGMDGEGRFELAHDTPKGIKRDKKFPPITLPNGDVVTNYTITLTFRRAADLEPGMSDNPKILNKDQMGLFDSRRKVSGPVTVKDGFKIYNKAADANYSQETINEIFDNYTKLMNRKREGFSLSREKFDNTAFKNLSVLEIGNSKILGEWDIKNNIFKGRVLSSKNIITLAKDMATIRKSIDFMASVPEDMGSQLERLGYVKAGRKEFTFERRDKDGNILATEDMVKSLYFSNEGLVQKVFGKPASKVTSAEVEAYDTYFNKVAILSKMISDIEMSAPASEMAKSLRELSIYDHNALKITRRYKTYFEENSNVGTKSAFNLYKSLYQQNSRKTLTKEDLDKSFDKYVEMMGIKPEEATKLKEFVGSINSLLHEIDIAASNKKVDVDTLTAPKVYTELDNDLNKTLVQYLSKFGIKSEAIKDIQYTLNIDSFATHSILNKVLQFDKDNQTQLPKEATELIVFMMQYNPNVKEIIGYMEEQQMFSDKATKEEKFKEVALLLNESLHKKTNTAIPRSLRERLMTMFRDFVSMLSKPKMGRLNRKVGYIADQVLIQNQALITASLYKPGAFGQKTEQVSLEKAMEKDAFGKTIIETLSEDGFILTGSTALAEQGTIKRPNENPLHDIDWVSPFDRMTTKEKFLGHYPDAIFVRDIFNDSYTTDSFLIAPEGYSITDYETSIVESEGKDNKIVIDSYKVVDANGVEVGKFFLDDKGKEQHKGVQGKVIDFFSYEKYNGSTPFVKNGVTLANWKDVFAAKLDYARYKDLWDYNRFIPTENLDIFTDPQNRLPEIKKCK